MYKVMFLLGMCALLLPIDISHGKAKTNRQPKRVTFAGKDATSAKKTRLFILSGQSNMAGLDETKFIIPHIEKAFPDDELIFVKDSQSGQPIRRWYKNWKPVGDWKPRNNRAKPGNNDIYKRLQGVLLETIKGKSIHSASFMWMQGEADARDKQSSNYHESLEGVIAQIRRDIKRQDLTVVIGRLSDHQQDNPHWKAVQQAQEAIAKAEAKGDWINTDAWNGPKDGLHYNGDGYKALGEAFAQKTIALLKRP